MEKPPHRFLVRMLLVIGAISTVLAVIAIWAERQLLDTDEWVETSSELLADAEIQSAVQGFLVEELFANVDVQAELAAALPPRAQPLAGPLTGALRQFAEQVAGRALDSPALEDAWAQANRTAHELLLNLLEGDGELVSAEGGAVTLDLRGLLEQLATRLGIDPAAVDKLPESVGSLEIIRSDELEAAQEAASLVRGLAIVFTILALGSLALAIFLARGRRPLTGLWCGLIMIGAGVVLFAFRSIAGQSLVDSLVEAESARAAAESTWSIATSLLTSIATTVIVYGIVLVVAAWLGSSVAGAPATRRLMAPTLRDHPGFVYGFVVLVGLVYFALAPTHGTRALLTIAVLIGAGLAGAVALRRKTAAEFPDEQGGRVGAAIRGFMERRRAAAAPAAPVASSVEELERLVNLRDQGVLNEDEFETQKELALRR